MTTNLTGLNTDGELSANRTTAADHFAHGGDAADLAALTAPVTAKAAPKANGAKAAPKAAPKAAAKGKGKAAPVIAAPVKRVSRIAPIQGRLLAKMQAAGAKGVSVAAMAESLGATEREVRLAIDRARAGANKIDRIGKGVFAFAKGFKYKPEATAK